MPILSRHETGIVDFSKVCAWVCLATANPGQRRTGKKTARTLYKVGQCVVPLPKQNTIIHDRVIETAGLLAESDDKQPVTFQHSILCQTCLPYRDPGDDVRIWERLNGTVHLKVLAGEAMHPKLGRLVPLGLPFGPKPRLVLAHVNTEALRSDSPEIEIEDSLTAFVKRLKLAGHGLVVTSVPKVPI